MNNLQGRPISGEIEFYSQKAYVEQWDEAKFIEELDKILDFPGVESVRWEQYTPYFNDGEACTFDVYDLKVKLVGDDESGDWEDGFITKYDTMDWKDGRWIPDEKYKDHLDLFEALEKFPMSRFERVLYEHFGDPAQVTATKEGFRRVSYDHD